jgi:signal transduction histidine kinase
MSKPSPGRLLVVDDDPALMAALRATLRDEGYQVTGVTSGAEALELLAGRGFDLLLTDLMMPRMDGIALLHQALAIDRNLAGIVMTGHGTIPTAVEAMKAGAIDYVLKPFKLGALLPALERALIIRHLRLENEALEKRVRERTAELEAANKELEAFCYSVSHDLRTPLRAISGFAEILHQRHGNALPPEAGRYLELIRRGASEMGQLISDLLAFSRFTRQAPSRQNVDLAQLCRDVRRDLAGEHHGRRVEWIIPALPAARGDPALLRQVVVNLLSNALKFTRPRRPAVIEVGVAPRKAGVDPVYFVRDNGVGFDGQDASRLFGVFQRLHTGRDFEGTGVGLATVRRIIERHGGRIWAESAPDAGATFFFTLPVEAGPV